MNQLTIKTIGVQARVVSSTPVTASLHRVVAHVSRKAPARETLAALNASISTGAALAGSFVELPEARRNNDYLATGFVIAVPHVITAQADKLQATLNEHGLKEVASNMYMDGDDRVWRVQKVGSTSIIVRDEDDDLGELLASINQAERSSGDQRPIKALSINFPDLIAHVDELGGLNYGIAMGTIEGAGGRIEVVPVGPSAQRQVQVVEPLAVVAAGDRDFDVDADAARDDPVQYWSKVYSEDPEMVNYLKSLVEESAVF